MAAKWINAIAVNLAIGNALAAAIGADTGDGETFTRGRLRTVGSGSQYPTAWAAGVPLTARGYELVAEFLTDGPWPVLNARGISDAMIEAGKQVLVIELGERDDIGGNMPSFLADNGYEPIPGRAPGLA